MKNERHNFRAEIKAALAAAPAEFEIPALAASLHIPEDEWETIVDADPEFLRDGGRVCRREAFFTGHKFLITPETWEIEAGILIPGHRFVPYLDPEVFPSETVLRTGRRRIRTKEMSLPLAQIVGCFPLLGTEQMMDVMIAESQANGFLRSGGARGDREVVLTVFDMAEFYREHDFEEGDALRCEVVDYRGGVVKFSFLSGSERSAAGKRRFIAALDDACAQVLRGAEDYLDVPEVLVQSIFRGAAELDDPGASLDEYIRESLKIVLGAGEDGRGELRIADAETEEDDGEVTLPEGLAISSGETGTLPAMLKATGTALTPEELDGFILDACATREMDFKTVFSRAFRGSGPHYSDAAQEAVFMNSVEDRFEELTAHYDRADDELKAPLRSSVMEAVEERLDFFAEAAALERVAESLTAEKLRQLATVAGRIGTLLKLLNREDFMPDAHEIEHLEAQLETFLDEQDAALEALREDLSETKKQPEDQ